jgi:hypothetical protein
MWYETPEMRLIRVNSRQRQLREEAARERRATAYRTSRRHFRGVHFHLGRNLIVVGRTLCEDDAKRLDPVCSRPLLRTGAR